MCAHPIAAGASADCGRNPGEGGGARTSYAWRGDPTHTPLAAESARQQAGDIEAYRARVAHPAPQRSSESPTPADERRPAHLQLYGQRTAKQDAIEEDRLDRSDGERRHAPGSKPEPGQDERRQARESERGKPDAQHGNSSPVAEDGTGVDREGFDPCRRGEGISSCRGRDLLEVDGIRR